VRGGDLLSLTLEYDNIVVLKFNYLNNNNRVETFISIITTVQNLSNPTTSLFSCYDGRMSVLILLTVHYKRLTHIIIRIVTYYYDIISNI